MLLPSKHVRIGESLLGLGSVVLSMLRKPRSLDSLWSELRAMQKKNALPVRHRLDDLVLTLGMLYSLGLVELRDDGRVSRAAD